MSTFTVNYQLADGTEYARRFATRGFANAFIARIRTDVSVMRATLSAPGFQAITVKGR